MARVLMVQNDAQGGPGRFGDWLTAAGLGVDVIHPYAGEPMPDRLEHDAFVPLGGGPMPDDDIAMPWLAASRALAAQALDQGTPLFGICQGGQLLAHVAGGTVTASHGEPETGSTPITLRPEAASDPLFTGLPHRLTAIERHVDAVTELPPGAVWLARSERCRYQAFRCGERAWGVQFHPEADAARVAEWDAEALRRRGLDPEEVRARAAADEPAAAEVWRQVAGRFARMVAAGG